jgi:hypothetical protein
MTRIKFEVPVAAEEDAVRKRINEAAENPEEFVRMFTKDRSVTAAVYKDGIGWGLRVTGPQFVARGSAEVLHDDPGSLIAIHLDVDARGIFILAGPAIALASNRIKDEATQTLQTEFGPRQPN